MWFGLVGQTSYAFSQSETMQPFRELLKKNTKFYWDDTLQKLFEQSWKLVVEKSREGVRMFTLDRWMCLRVERFPKN